MLSIYLHHIIGFSSKALRIFSSKPAINKISYGGANFVPIFVPVTCLKVFSSNSKMKNFNIMEASMKNLVFKGKFLKSQYIGENYLKRRGLDSLQI